MAIPVISIEVLKYFRPIISFIFIFVVIFAILEKSKALGKDKQNLNSLIALVICIYFYFKNKKIRLPLIFLISGIIGNSTDRILFGHVRDFINVGFFPVFNLADSFNFIGIVLLIILLWKK